MAYVSTNSITMGEQVGVLWRGLLPLGCKIRFGHRTFVWSNEEKADKPTRFHLESIPKVHSLVLPKVSSEKRRYIPVGYVGAETLCWAFWSPSG